MKKMIIIVIISVIALSSIAIFSLGKYASIKLNSDANSISQGQKSNPSSDSSNIESSSSSSSSSSSGSSSSSTPDSSSLEEKHYCSPESREVESCELIDNPVCGWFDQTKVQCGDNLCIRSTFPNECDACTSDTILYWTEGDCPLHD